MLRYKFGYTALGKYLYKLCLFSYTLHDGSCKCGTNIVSFDVILQVTCYVFHSFPPKCYINFCVCVVLGFQNPKCHAVLLQYFASKVLHGMQQFCSSLLANYCVSCSSLRSSLLHSCSTLLSSLLHSCSSLRSSFGETTA